MSSKLLLRQLRPISGFNSVPRCPCHAIPSSASEAQLLISAMREDALCRIGLDTNYRKAEVSSYLDKPTDRDDDLEFPAETSRDSLLALCDHHLRTWPPPFTRDFSELQSSFLFGEPLRVLQWNVLAQALGTQNDNFVQCHEETFDWSVRRWRMLEEIIRHDPDVICLQELDHPRLVIKALKSIGYSGKFLHKPDSPCIYMTHNNGPDGAAIFYKTSKFDLISWTSKVLKVWDVASNQVILGGVLRSRHSGQELVVATTHLKAKFGDLRASFRHEQSKDILKWLEAIRGGRPIILAGDLNGLPSESFFSMLTSDQDVPLVSSYGVGEEEDIGEVTAAKVEYTTWKVRDSGEQKHVLDYILHTPGQLETLRTLNVPDEAAVGEDRLPSLRFSSDHMSLVADISLISYIN